MPARHTNRITVPLSLLLLLLVFAAPFVAPPAHVHAASFTVDTTVDTPDANPGNGACADATGACSLRAAVEEANASIGVDTIHVPAETFILGEPLVIEDDLFLRGAGRTATTIDGNNASELLNIRTVELLVCDSGNHSIASYDRNGKRNVDFLGASAYGLTNPGAIAIGYDNDVFVAAYSSGVHRFAPKGPSKGIVLSAATPGLRGFAPTDVMLDGKPDNYGAKLYVADYYPISRVIRADQHTGAQSTFVNDDPGGLKQPSSLAFNNGSLYVSSTGSNQILRYNAASGAFQSVFVPTYPSGLDRPRGIVFHNNALFVANEGSNSVLKYNAANGAFEGVFVPPGSGGLNKPSDITFGPDGDLYVLSRGTESILRYNGETGTFRGVFVAADNEHLFNPSCLTWRTGAGHGPQVNISNLSLRNGKTMDIGGPTSGITIDSGADVSILRSNITNNSSSVFGGGIQNWGELSLIEVEVRGNQLPEGGGGMTSQGGGVFNAGKLLVLRSLIVDNYATRGGGISNVNQGEVDIIASTISSNRAIGAGGGIRNVVDGVVRITGSTITKNRTNEPGALSGDEPTRFGGGIYTSATALTALSATILAENEDNRSRFNDDYSPDCYSATAGRFVSHRSNLVGILTANCLLGDVVHGDTRFDQVGTAETPLDPRLLLLTTNGGETRTYALHSDSPAIDADTHTTNDNFFHCRAWDQRYVTRPQGNACDAGAFELIQGLGTAAVGSSELVGATPTTHGEAGIVGTLTNRTPGSPPIELRYAVFVNNPGATPLTSLGERFFQIGLSAADAADTLELSIYYPAGIDPAAEGNPNFRLLYLAGDTWQPVRSSGGAAPTHDPADNLERSISGGRFSFTLDATSFPAATDLNETLFAVAIAAEETPNPAPEPPVAAPHSIYLPFIQGP